MAVGSVGGGLIADVGWVTDYVSGPVRVDYNDGFVPADARECWKTSFYGHVYHYVCHVACAEYDGPSSVRRWVGE